MGMFNVSVQKTFTDAVTDDSLLYTYSATAATQEEAVALCCMYASMVEYGVVAAKWKPSDMAFPREQLYQFVQPATLNILENVYPDVVKTAYMNATAYVQSYLGAMFDIDAMLASGDTSSTALTLRLALCISTVTFILASSPQYSETIEQHNKQLHHLLRGLKSGQRNFGKAAIAGEPNVRVEIVTLSNKGARP